MTKWKTGDIQYLECVLEICVYIKIWKTFQKADADFVIVKVNNITL